MTRSLSSETPLWLTELLKQDEITDICIQRDSAPHSSGVIFIDRGQGMEKLNSSTHTSWSEEEIRQWLLDQLSLSGRTWDARYPFVDARLRTGHRLHVAFPPLAQQGITISIRRLPSAFSETGVKSNRLRSWTNSPQYSLLHDATIRGDSILIAGATGSGKTTLASELLASVPENERIIALEDTPELAPDHPHFLSLISRPPNADGYGEITLRTLIKQVLRMRPDRIILGECRGAEVLELLQALNTGHRGALATLHANSPRDALRRIELLCLLAAAGSIPLFAIRELISSGVQWVAQVKKTGGTRVISEIWKVEGREGDTILMRPMIREKNAS